MAAPGPETPGILTVVAALATNGTGPEARLFLARRAPGLRDAGLWELPGGKVEAGEAPEAALLRELQEELGVDATILGPPQRHDLALGHFPCVFLVIPVRLGGPPAVLEAHDEWAYVAPGDLDGLSLASLDGPAVAAWRREAQRTSP